MVGEVKEETAETTGPPSPARLDIAPFTADRLWKAGSARRWGDLRRVLAPLLGDAFAVTDPASLALVDDVRRLLDSSADPDTGSGLVRKVALAEADGDADMLAAVLETGADPDLPNAGRWTALHACASLGRAAAADVLLACRPDLTARNENWETPLDCARDDTYQFGDVEKSWREALRLDVAKVIEKRVEAGFQSIAELVCRRRFFAVKNLVRRRAVSAAEFAEKYRGKSAVEWARAFREDAIVGELEYYAALCPETKLRGAESVVDSLRNERDDDNEEKMGAEVEEESDPDVETNYPGLQEEQNGETTRPESSKRSLETVNGGERNPDHFSGFSKRPKIGSD